MAMTMTTSSRPRLALSLLLATLLAGCVRSPQAQTSPSPATGRDGAWTGPIPDAPRPLPEGMQGGLVGGSVRLLRDLSDVGGDLFFPGVHTNEEAAGRDVALLLEPEIPEFDRPIDPDDAPEAKILALGSVTDQLAWMLTLPGVERTDLRPMKRPQTVPGCAMKVNEYDPEARYAFARLAIRISHTHADDEPEANLPNPPDGFELLDPSWPLPDQTSGWKGRGLMYVDRDVKARTVITCPDSGSVHDTQLDLKAGWNQLEVRESVSETGAIHSVQRVIPLQTLMPLRGVH